MKAIGGDCESAGLGLRVVEPYADPRRVLLDADAAVIKAHRAGAETVHDRVKQDRVKIGPVDRKMRVLVTGEATARLREDGLAVPVEIGEFARLHAVSPQFRFEAEPGQRADRVGQHVDADAERFEFGHRFVDLARLAAGMERKRQGQTANPAPYDGYSRFLARHRGTMFPTLVPVNSG